MNKFVVEKLIWPIFITGAWGLTTFTVLGMFIVIFDAIFNTKIFDIIENVFSGNHWYTFLKIWLCGLPFSILTKTYKY